MKESKREQTVDEIKQKFGNNAIMPGAVMTGELGLYDGSAEDGGDKSDV